MDEQDDVKIEAEEEGVNSFGKSSSDALASAKSELETCRAEKQEYMDGWQRSKADFVNLLKRNETESKAAQLKGVLKAVEALLPGFDSLERAKEHGEIPEGFVGIAKQLEAAFTSLGLEPVGSKGERFDPALHEAYGQDSAPTLKEDETVSVVLEKGWRVGEHIVRPAKVRVAHFTQTI